MLSQGFDDSFFNDALDIDFVTPYNLPIPSPSAPKKDLIAQIDAAKDDDEPLPGSQLLKYNQVWYVRAVVGWSLYSLANTPTGRSYKTAPRHEAAISIWTVSAPTCKRRPSATASVLSSARRISSTPSRNICARRNRWRPESTLPRSRRGSNPSHESARLALGTAVNFVQQTDGQLNKAGWRPRSLAVLRRLPSEFIGRRKRIGRGEISGAAWMPRYHVPMYGKERRWNGVMGYTYLKRSADETI